MSLQIFITLAVAVAAVVAQSTPLTINTPTSVQACLPVQLSWKGGVPPYFVSLIPGGQPSAPSMKDLGKQADTSLTWNVDLPAGTSVSVQIRDNTGAINYSDKVTIQPSSEKCTTSGGGASSSGPSTPPKSGTAGASPSTPNSPSTPSGNSSSSSSSSNSTIPSSSTPTSTSTGGSAAATGAPASDASHNIPGIFALGLAAALAAFA